MKNYSELDEAVYLTGITTIVAWFGMAFYIAYVTAYDMFQKFRSERMVKLTQKHLKEKNMKTIAFAILMLGLASQSKAQVLTNATSVKIVVPYLTTCSSMTIGVTPTEITGNTRVISTTAGISQVKVTNLNTAQTVYCNHDPAVTSSGNNIGDSIVYSPSTGARNWLAWGIAATQGWYCVASGSNVSIEVCRVR